MTKKKKCTTEKILSINLSFPCILEEKNTII